MRQNMTEEQRDALLAQFERDLRELLKRGLRAGFEPDDLAELADAVLQGEWE